MAAALDSIVDERGSPDKRIVSSGTPVLQPTAERRSTGSHYTPRSLTEPIVRHALEPVFERLGPNARPEEVLDLKVCDPAMGSGAFLVEACRALAARLVQAWPGWPETRPKLPPDEDEDLHARRLVAQRCLYGVDKNPMATDLAKTVAMARYPSARPRVHLSRSCAEKRRQPRRLSPRPDRRRALGQQQARPAAVPNFDRRTL